MICNSRASHEPAGPKRPLQEPPASPMPCHGCADLGHIHRMFCVGTRTANRAAAVRAAWCPRVRMLVSCVKPRFPELYFLYFTFFSVMLPGTLAAHHQPVEVGIDPRVLTGPTPDKGTTVTTTSWPSFWDQIDHHQPVEVGIDPRILTGPTPDKDTTITMTSWPSFWDQIDRGDHDTHLAVFDGVSLATSGADHDPFNMFPTDHPHWLLS